MWEPQKQFNGIPLLNQSEGGFVLNRLFVAISANIPEPDFFWIKTVGNGAFHVINIDSLYIEAVQCAFNHPVHSFMLMLFS